MDTSLNSRLWIATSVLVVILVWLAVGASGALATPLQLIAYAAANFVVTGDLVDLLARLWLTRLHGATKTGPAIDLNLAEISLAEKSRALRPYAIVVSVHNAADDIDRFTTAMRAFRHCTWVMDDASTDNTAARLRFAGWRCLTGHTNRKKPGALLTLLGMLPVGIETVVVLDPDVRLRGDPEQQRQVLEEVLRDFQRSAAAALTPRIVVEPGGWLAACQALEYELSGGLGRKSLADYSTTSGVSVYRRDALLSALQRHSLSVYAEDFENAVLLLSRGERVYYDDRLAFMTDGKHTLATWFSQRVGWSFGWAKVFMERSAEIWRIARRSPLAAYQYVMYLGVVGIVLFPLKVVGFTVFGASCLRGFDFLLGVNLIPELGWNSPVFFAACFVKMIVVLFAACQVAVPRGERLRHLGTLPLYVFYALLQCGPIAVGFINVISLRLFGRRIYADHYDARPVLLREAAPAR
jgi:cellulose synthase/poly-beta-1,6-N-acetylglucosamine synthase-like glycosyltransferase